MIERDNRLDVFIAISVVLHALLFWAFLRPVLSSLELPSLRPAIEVVELPASFRSPRIALPAVKPQPPPQATPVPAKKAPPPVPPPESPRDVVDIPKPAVEQAPRDARLLSRYNQRVERQARARDLPIDTRGEISRRRKADVLAPPAAGERDQQAAERQEARKAEAARPRAVAGGGDGAAARPRAPRPGAPGAVREEAPPEPVSADAIFRKHGSGKAGAGGTRSGTAGPGTGAGRGPGVALKDLIPREERLAQLETGPTGGQTNPYNPDLVPADAAMSMDTLRDENVGYWLAVKKRIVLNWDPARLVRAANETYQQTLQNFGGGSMLAQSAGDSLTEAALRTGQGTTVVRFVIAKNGRLAGEPVLVRSSASRFLDDEALRAVRYADPFPPVPDRLAKKSLTITGEFIYGRR